MSIRFTASAPAVLALAAALTLPAGAASAVTLALGSNNLTGTSLAAEPNLAGVVVEDELTNVSFAFGAETFSATVQSQVVLATDGTYDFYWRIRDTGYTGTDDARLSALRLGNLGIPTVGLNGDYRTDDVGDVGPDEALVFDGPFVNFLFNDGLAAGSESYFMFLDTEATSYGRTAAFDVTFLDQAGFTDTFATFGVGVVPEPATWALMIGGFGLAGAALRRRQGLAA